MNKEPEESLLEGVEWPPPLIENQKLREETRAMTTHKGGRRGMIIHLLFHRTYRNECRRCYLQSINRYNRENRND